MLILAGTLLVWQSDPIAGHAYFNPWFVPGCMAVLGTPLVALSGIHAAAALADRQAARAYRLRGRRRPWRWLVLPLAVLLLTCGFVFELPLRMRFALSRGAFERVVQRALAVRPCPNCDVTMRVDRYVGLYFVESVHVDARRNEVFVLTNENLFDESGFVRPLGPNTVWSDEIGLGHNWYPWR